MRHSEQLATFKVGLSRALPEIAGSAHLEDIAKTQRSQTDEDSRVR